MVQKILFIPTEQRYQVLKDLSHQTSLSSSEILRRMMDYCFQDSVINQLVPAMSGHLQVRR